jgi:hypothetical protein
MTAVQSAYPDNGHIVARNMYRKKISILRKTVHQVGFIYKIMQGRRSTEHTVRNKNELKRLRIHNVAAKAATKF